MSGFSHMILVGSRGPGGFGGCRMGSGGSLCSWVSCLIGTSNLSLSSASEESLLERSERLFGVGGGLDMAAERMIWVKKLYWRGWCMWMKI